VRKNGWINKKPAVGRIQDKRAKLKFWDGNGRWCMLSCFRHYTILFANHSTTSQGFSHQVQPLRILRYPLSWWSPCTQNCNYHTSHINWQKRVNNIMSLLTLYGHIKTAEQQSIIQQYSNWYTGHWSVGCYIWYSEEGPGASHSPLLAVRNVTVHWLLMGGLLHLVQRGGDCAVQFNLLHIIQCVTINASGL